MPKASVTRHIAREKQKLIDFVLDIEKYPEFIPFCIDSKVYERNDKKDEVKINEPIVINLLTNVHPKLSWIFKPVKKKNSYKAR